MPCGPVNEPWGANNQLKSRIIMSTNEIKSVFDRTFNGMPNPVFCHPYKYFEHKGYLCELASSASGAEMAREVGRDLNKTPLAMFGMMFSDCGNMLTVLTANGERTSFGGQFRTENELNELLNMI